MLTVLVTCAANLVAVWHSWQESAQPRAAESERENESENVHVRVASERVSVSDLLGVLNLEPTLDASRSIGSGSGSGERPSETVSEKERARATAQRLVPALRRALYSSDLKRAALLLVTNLAAGMDSCNVLFYSWNRAILLLMHART